MVIDTLRGSKNEKVLRSGLDRLSTYGICEQSEHQLRAIMQHLILCGYLIKTDSEYPTIKLGGRADEILRGETTVHMKLQKDSPVSKPEKQPELKPVDKRLLAALRDLRRLIADELNLPAFVIFHDSTLTDMCMKLPRSQEELLNVSGVGKVKAQRYGDQFLDVISNFL